MDPMNPTNLKVYHLVVVVANLAFLVIKAFGNADPVRFTRPLMLIFRSTKVVKAIVLFLNSILSAAAVFIVFFFTIVLAAVLALVLFQGDKLVDGDGGEIEMGNFMACFNEMFVLVATGENYADIVPAAVMLSDWYFLYFAVFTLVGLFFLGSLLIATFEGQYQREQVEFVILEKDRLLHRIAPTFCLWTYNMSASKDVLKDNEDTPEEITKSLTIKKKAFNILMEEFWKHSSQLETLKMMCGARRRKEELDKRKKQAKIEAALKVPPEEVDLISLERDVKALEFPITSDDSPEIESMRETMKEYAERVFVLLDTDGTEDLDFEEFAEICTYLKLMPELHINDVFYKEMQKESSKNKKELKMLNLETPEVKLSPEQLAKEEFSISQLNDQLDTLGLDLEKAKYVAEDWFYGLPERDVDSFVTVYTALQCMFLGCYGTILKPTMVDWFTACFASGHILDVVLRIIQMKGLSNYLQTDGRGDPEVRLKRRCTSVLVSVSALGLILYVIATVEDSFVDGPETKFFQMLMAVTSFRLILTVRQFAELLYSISAGLEQVTVYFIILLIIMSSYSSAAYVLFRNCSGGLNYWVSPFDSFMTMFQLLVGEGWNGVMNDTTANTYKVVQFFFMSYTLLTTILFSQLFLGIIIQLYTTMEDLRRDGDHLYVILGSLCPDKREDKAELDKLIWGLMSTQMGTIGENYSEEFVHTVLNIQKHWRLRRNQKLCRKIQDEVHPICALLDRKFKHDKQTIEKYLSAIPMNHAFVHVPTEVIPTDSWFEQHFLIMILNQSFTLFTGLTNVRLKNADQVFGLLSCLGNKLRLFTDFVEVTESYESNTGNRTVSRKPLSELLLKQYQDHTHGNEFSIFSDIVLHGDLRVIVERIAKSFENTDYKIKEEKGNRILGNGDSSTVYEDLLDAAEQSENWGKKNENQIFSKDGPWMVAILDGSPDDDDTNMGQMQDVDRRQVWQDLIAYTVQAAKEGSLYGSKSQRKSEYDMRMSSNSNTFHDQTLNDAANVQNPEAVAELDCLTRIVRLRALLSRTDFGHPWDFSDFAHWFLDAFYLPIQKVWV